MTVKLGAGNQDDEGRVDVIAGELREHFGPHLLGYVMEVYELHEVRVPLPDDNIQKGDNSR